MKMFAKLKRTLACLLAVAMLMVTLTACGGGGVSSIITRLSKTPFVQSSAYLKVYIDDGDESSTTTLATNGSETYIKEVTNYYNVVVITEGDKLYYVDLSESDRVCEDVTSDESGWFMIKLAKATLNVKDNLSNVKTGKYNVGGVEYDSETITVTIDGVNVDIIYCFEGSAIKYILWNIAGTDTVDLTMQVEETKSNVSDDSLDVDNWLEEGADPSTDTYIDNNTDTDDGTDTDTDDNDDTNSDVSIGEQITITTDITTVNTNVINMNSSSSKTIKWNNKTKNGFELDEDVVYSVWGIDWDETSEHAVRGNGKTYEYLPDLDEIILRDGTYEYTLDISAKTYTVDTDEYGVVEGYLTEYGISLAKTGVAGKTTINGVTYYSECVKTEMDGIPVTVYFCFDSSDNLCYLIVQGTTDGVTVTIKTKISNFTTNYDASLLDFDSILSGYTKKS